MTLIARTIVTSFGAPCDCVRLDSQDRHLRRKRLMTGKSEALLVDFDHTVQLHDGDGLLLEDGRVVVVEALPEDLLEVRAASPGHLTRLAWHIGNRHLEAQIEATRILIRRDHVIAHMLEHQGAKLREVCEAFSPENGAYHSHAHGETVANADGPAFELHNHEK